MSPALKKASEMHMEEVQEYLRIQQASLQWGPVLSALSSELESRSDPMFLRQLFSNVGRRMADELVGNVTDVRTLKDLSYRLNDLWAQINWGWVKFVEQDGRLHIIHFCSPLADTFGQRGLSWSVGLLEGFYERVFTLMWNDAAPGHVRAVMPIESGDILRLSFSF